MQETETISTSWNGRAFIKWLFYLLVISELLLIVADATLNRGDLTGLSQIRRMFNIAREDGIGTWFASMQFLLISLVSACIGLRVKHQPVSRFSTVGWFLLSLFFLFLSIDDAAQVHERIGSAVKALGNARSPGGGIEATSQLLKWFPSYPWQILLGPFYLLFGFFGVLFFWREGVLQKAPLALVVTAICCALAIALDYVEGLPNAHQNLTAFFELDNAETFRHFAKSLEEFLEMFGFTFLLSGLLYYLFSITPKIEVSIEMEKS